MKRIGLIIGIIIVLAIVGLALSHHTSSSPTTGSVPQTSSPSTTASQAQSAATITYDSSGFHPAMTTVKSGDSVTFVNKSSEEIQVDSDPHPVHTDDIDLNVGTIAPGQSRTVVLTKTGTFGFHNHLEPTDMARITIE